MTKLKLSLVAIMLLVIGLQTSRAALSDKEKKAAALAALAANKVTGDDSQKKSSLKLASIDVTGVDDELKKNIELHMPVTVPECNADRAEVAQFFTTVKKHLRSASRALGYYDADFRSGGSIVNGCWKLRLRITPGSPVKVVSQNFQVTGPGKNEQVFKKILKEYPYKIGDPLNHQLYSDFKTKLSEAADSLGYFDAEFEKHTITVSPELYQAKIDLVLNTGTEFQYGVVSVDQDVLSDKRIKSYILLKQGAPYRTEAILEQQQFLQQTGYYKLIKINVLHDQAKNNQVPIEIKLVAKKRNAYVFKVGFGSDTGARVSAEMDRRWLGKSGKQLKLKTQYSQTLSGINAQLIAPRKNPKDDSLVYKIDIQKDSTTDVLSRSIEIGGNLTSKLNNDWVRNLSVGLLLDETQVDGQDTNNSNLLLFGVGFEKTKTNHPLYPTKGWQLKLSTTGALKNLLSDQNVLQFKVFGKKLIPLGKGRISASATVGTTYVDNFDDLPKKLRFFAGGSNSVRGYGFESLGDVNDEGLVIGSKNLFTSSLEYQHPITAEWSAAAFVDVGNAFDQWNDVKLKVGVGVGARWRSPVGPVKVDIGFPKDDFSAPHLHLSVGSDL